MSTEEKTNALALAGTSNEYVPSAFVVVPVVVPLTSTDTLATGLPFSSVTLPVIVRCAMPGRQKTQLPKGVKTIFSCAFSF